MIARFWNALFDYGEECEKDSKSYEIYQDICTILQRVYDNGNTNAVIVKGKEPVDKVEEMVLTIPDIMVFHDMTDDTYFYELDGKHFDSADEVIKYLIETRKKLQVQCMKDAQTNILNHIYQWVKKIDKAELIGKETPHRVQEVKDAKETKKQSEINGKLTKEYLRKAHVEDGLTIGEIARITHFDRKTIEKKLIQHGLPIAKRGYTK